MIKPDKEPHDFLTWPQWLPAFSAAILIIVVGGLTTWLALQFDALRPRVGDMIVFTPTIPDSDSWRLQVDPTAVVGRDATAGPCVFDPSAIAATGGSLIVEARQDTSPPRFQLHWAGQRTAHGADDCGPAVDLTLDRYDLQRLANAAGGFGIRQKVIR